MAESQECRDAETGHGYLSVRRIAAAVVHDRNITAGVQHVSRRSEPAGSVVGGLYVRESAPCRALRNSARLWLAVSPGAGDGRESSRDSWAWQHPDGHVVSKSDVRRAARQVGAGNAARHPAPAAAAGCAGAEGGATRHAALDAP